MSRNPGHESKSFEAGRVRGIVFDLDGTLIDSYSAIASSLNHARARYALAPLPAADVRRRVGRGLESLIAECVGERHVVEGVRLFRAHYEEVFRESTRRLPGTREALQRLHGRGIAMSVASNKPARFGRPILRGLDLERFLVCIEGPDSAGTTKPEPTMLRRCMKAMGIPPAAGLYVGDMPLDVETAARAGVPVVLVPGGSASGPELRSTGATVVDDLRGLADLLGA